ncbi:bifunctional 4-hydroxy-2-oxoglutarate aldolase/2-dehydro-3-deoxy-phosphogluconate aldolase [Dactylosporangium sp. NPDC000521]|uniref:bifunctional 4-hydroxy-2-oxoglutarate aldolase/2-dehydro-3-deoxy-phosphogluconate aldolase n=1 Tax=Dactylosporangium sp. NPDC000521 TaxID=3363975 RepID=UPI0036C1E397
MSSIVDVVGGNRIVPVVVLDDPAAAEPLADALVAGGLPIAEVTFRTAAAAAAIARMAKHGGVTVGAGTVTTPAQVDAAVAAGATFVVSPGLSAAVVNRCRFHNVPALPGATTATEIMAALELGVDVLKFFPAGTSGGARAVAALAAPFAQVRFVPTGGIDASNVRDYLGVPSVLAVGGSWMVPRASIAAGDFAAVTALAAEAVAAAA